MAVPYGPSFTRMRSWAMWRRRSAFSVRVMAADSQQVAQRERQVRAVQRIEMELVDALGIQAAAEIPRDRCGDHAASLDVVVEAVEHVGQPTRHLGAAQAGHLLDALEVRDRHDARHDRHVDAGLRRGLAEAQEVVALEEELGDAAVGAGIDLALQVLEVGIDARRIGMLLGIARDADLEVADLLQAGDQCGGIGVAAGMRAVLAAHAARRIATQRHDVADAGVPVGAGDIVDLALGGGDAGEMGGGLDAGLLLEPHHRLVRALAGRAAGAVGHGEESGLERRETLDRLPQGALGRLGLGRRELERDLQPLRAAGGEFDEVHRVAPCVTVAARLLRCGASRSPRQMPVIRRRPGKCNGSSGLRPALRSQPCTWLSAKPRWTWACSRFSSTRSWGEKSTTSTTPPGFTTRAASASAAAGSSA